MVRAEQLVEMLSQAKALYYQLILVVAPAGSGKTGVLQELSNLSSAPLINVNLELSRRMLELTEQQRILKVRQLLGEIVDGVAGEVALLDNIEILFDTHLQQDPLTLLQKLSRNKTIVAAWNGTAASGHLTYATPEHHEYRRYPVRDFLVAEPAAK